MDQETPPQRKSNPSRHQKAPKKARHLGWIALAILSALVVVAAFNQPSKITEVPITQAVQEANAGKYAEIK